MENFPRQQGVKFWEKIQYNLSKFYLVLETSVFDKESHLKWEQSVAVRCEVSDKISSHG